MILILSLYTRQPTNELIIAENLKDILMKGSFMFVFQGSCKNTWRAGNLKWKKEKNVGGH